MPNDNEPPLDREERAHALLRWSTPAPIAEFDEALGSRGFYSSVQRERSDKALDAFDQDNREAPGLSELDAFRILESQGVLTQADFYSPTKAANGFYRKLLKQKQNNKRADRRNRLGAVDSQQTIEHQEISTSNSGRIADQGSAGQQRQRRSYRGVSRRAFRTQG